MWSQTHNYPYQTRAAAEHCMSVHMTAQRIAAHNAATKADADRYLARRYRIRRVPACIGSMVPGQGAGEWERLMDAYVVERLSE